jgi:hypothetical protein
VRFAVGVLASLALVLSPGCGGGEKLCLRHGVRCENLPQRKVYSLDWIERTPRGAAVFRVRRIEVGANGWKVRASVTNGAPRTFRFPTGGPRSPISFGLGVFNGPLPRRVEEAGNYLLRPQKVEPPFPAELAPGKTWRGTMSSSVAPRPRRWLRVLFGVFFWKGKAPYDLGPYFAWQTGNTVQAPSARGPGAPEPGAGD